MKGYPGSHLNRALPVLHLTTRTRNEDSAILQYNMKQLQTFPHCLRALVKTHLFLIIIML